MATFPRIQLRSFVAARRKARRSAMTIPYDAREAAPIIIFNEAHL
ncbi:hypothetical protein [Bradyrhizobium elkanii]|nr:hypothetical protein [Bradyrhizobium elkanii]WLC12544.1 hypothetical protein QIH86_45435 [Bradyrhizobium elkanii USDA 94]WLC12731.1 hypothetical protein QIH86_46775 [Bradyrhizobium elkanii USDA 94]